MKSIRDFDLQGKRVLLRLDVNVPLSDDGSIEDDFRIQGSIPTVQYVLDRKGVCVIIAHLGRADKRQSLKPVAQALEELSGKQVKFLDDCIGEKVEAEVKRLQAGEVVLLENLRFYEGETKNDPEFAQQLARLGDLYVNDAFAVDHREHASIVGVPQYLPSAAGLLLEKETQALSKIRENPDKPMVVVVGGAKVETKASFLEHMSKQADAILLGNLMTREVKAKKLSIDSQCELVFAEDGDFDLGLQTIERFAAKIAEAKTIFWAGPLGKIEESSYEKGSLAVAEAISQSKAFSVAGGGDLVAFLRIHGFQDKFSHLSTGGSAMLAFLAGEELPGLKALDS
jgi:phosphoglycerate kinase